MKSETQIIITLDDFHLQLSQLQQKEEQIDQKVNPQQQFFLLRVQPLPMSISSVQSWVYFALHLMWLAHFVFSYVNCFSSIYGGTNLLVSLKTILNNFSSVGAGINGVMVVIGFLSMVFPKVNKDAGLLFLLEYIGAETYPYLRYILQINLYLSTFFASSDNAVNLLIYGLASIASLFHCLFLQNLTLRKGQFCCKSIEYSLVWRLILLTSMSIGILGMALITSEDLFIVWALAQLALGILLIVCYYSFGLYIYRNKIPRYFFFAIISSFMALAMAAFFDSLHAKNKRSMGFYLASIIFLITTIFFNWSTLQRRRRISACPQNTSLKEKIYFLFNKYEGIDGDEEDDCQIRGIFHYHSVSGCNNGRCVVNLKEVYDSKKKKNCSINKIGQSRVSLIKYYVKCLYERALEEDPQNNELRLDYTQFYYLKLKNIFNVLQQVAILQQKLLSPFQRLRLSRLKNVIHRQCNGFSQQLYLHNLSMQKTLKAEQTFNNIQKSMEIVIQRRELFWKYIERSEVFLSDILGTIRPNFTLVDKIEQNWNSIADYFNINRRWKFYFLCFTLFIKNQKLKPTVIEDFGNNVEYDIIFKTDNHFIDKTSQKQALFNPIMLFQQNTCFISVTCDQEKMLVRRVSNYFERNFDHNPRNVINSSIDVLMPPSIRSFHHAMFLSWVKEGRTNNEECYPVKEIMPMTSRGYLAPCFKFYKYYLRNQGEIEYIAMLKRNNKDQLAILANHNFQIQAITIGLAQKLKIGEDDYKSFRGQNLLSLIPMLAKYTRYCKFINQNDEYFMENDQNQVYYRKKSGMVKDKSQGELDILGYRKLLNLTNLKMFIPTDMEDSKQFYKGAKRQRKGQFDAIRHSFQNMRKSKRYSKFRGEMYIRERNYHPHTDQKFYQFEINELEESNKLQKIKMEESQSGNQIEAGSSREIENVSMNEIDMQMFLQLNKKKNKVVLFPSNNIFLKDQNNQALTQIRHITSISLSVRFIVAVFIVILMAILLVEVVLAGKFGTINQQYYWVAKNQKMLFLLNSQYNIQHIQPGNNREETFFIQMYTSKLLETMSQASLQKLLFDQKVNPPRTLQPYYPDPYPYTVTSMPKCPPLDQVSIFRKLREQAIALNLLTSLNPANTLQVAQYHIFNNYIYSYYDQSQLIKTNLVSQYQKTSGVLSQIVLILGIVEVVLIVLSFLFSLSRLLKVTNGFSELLSIFIQMDNADIKKILKYMHYVEVLFNHLKVRYQKMGEIGEVSASGITNNQDFDKFSTEQGKPQEAVANTTNANLNKKLKKIELGNQIKNIQFKAVGLMLAFLILVGLSLFIPVIYSEVSLNNMDTVENLGFTIMANGSLPNGIMTGVAQIFRGSQLYTFSKYSTMLDDLAVFAKSPVPLTLSQETNELGVLYKLVTFQKLCTKNSQIINQTLNSQLNKLCDTGVINASECLYLRSTLTEAFFVGQCNTLQHEQLQKGALSYFNYLINRYILVLKGISTVSTNDVMALNRGFNILAMYELQLMKVWQNLTSNIISTRLVYMIIVTCAAFFLVLVLHLVFVQYFIAKTLNNNYQMFRRMHENLIPQFVINKEKIIKAKLIKEGFMKE